MPSLITPQTIGIMIYTELMPIPGGVLEQVAKAEKAFELLGGVTPERAVRPAPSESETTPRTRASSINNAIVAFLSKGPLTMRTPRQVWSSIKSAYPKQTTETVQTRLKKDAGKPGLWIPMGNKYGMPGATAAVGAKNTTATSAEANANVVPAPAAVAGEKAQTRILNYVTAHGGQSQRQVISAFAASLTPIKAQYVGVELSRLIKAKKITGSKTSPYWALAAAKPTAAAAGIGDGAAPPA